MGDCMGEGVEELAAVLLWLYQLWEKVLLKVDGLLVPNIKLVHKHLQQARR